jgi:N6-adenosine-specific RNA methylase IME4
LARGVRNRAAAIPDFPQKESKSARELWLCRRGRTVAPLMGTQMPQMISHPRLGHSIKLQVFYDHIARLYPGCDLLEMFARPPLRPGWWSWGDEVPGKLAPPGEG